MIDSASCRAGSPTVDDARADRLRRGQSPFGRNALRRGRDDVAITPMPSLRKADRIVLPGVGAFGACAAALRAVPAWSRRSSSACARDGVPFLGICVGMQLMADARRGNGRASTGSAGSTGAGPARSTPADPAAKVPHMGWNDVVADRPAPADRAGRGVFPPQLSRSKATTCSPRPTMPARSPPRSGATI